MYLIALKCVYVCMYVYMYVVGGLTTLFGTDGLYVRCIHVNGLGIIVLRVKINSLAFEDMYVMKIALSLFLYCLNVKHLAA